MKNSVYVNGEKYQVLEKGEYFLMVNTPNGVKKAVPQWIGWTFAGYTFAHRQESP